MGCKPPHRRHEARLGASHRFIVRLIVHDGRYEMLPLPAVRIRLGLLGRPSHVGLIHLLALVNRAPCGGMAAGRNRKSAFGALAEHAKLLLAVFHRAAGVEEFRAIGKRVFNGIAVEILIV